jgi:hypothetical protein
MAILKNFVLSAFLMATLLSSAYGFSSVMAVPPDLIKGNYVLGHILGVQDDEQGNTTWLLFGTWKSNLNNNTNSETNNSSSVFNAAIEMIKPDGTMKHTHALTNFVLSNSSNTNSNTTEYNGTSTINLKESPVNEVPTSIKVMNNSVLSIWLNPASVKNHFGDDEIYGIIVNSSDVKRGELGTYRTS